MTTFIPSRRALLRGALLAPILGLSPAAFAQATANNRFKGVAVDVTPLLDHGGGHFARQLGEVLLTEMRGVFADRLGEGPLLTARITNLFFADFSGGADNFAFGHNDNIEGDGIVSASGRVVSTTHILTELPPSYSGAYYLPDIDHRRLGAIAHQFAYWLRREMNL